ncbi:uncharacterized protein MELLADRAFT_72126 [Melampsora larici-populina 98AG31]|uniref:Uncharacterized protein n=1 Tax=Melampsora larici-populina (strain 98AG31 / pathotype 3-4-7) TaxID=747676 RepID=F4RQL3_MELLP|nr:uncharacterized protein MELLADRAFT_72126 [Melampsora larici-populina 98AG31]EGG05494.1 hypothetical protein MELLADRAFT_72126 [Melampsora larici-populina 98AG31]
MHKAIKKLNHHKTSVKQQQKQPQRRGDKLGDEIGFDPIRQTIKKLGGREKAIN